EGDEFSSKLQRLDLQNCEDENVLYENIEEMLKCYLLAYEYSQGRNLDPNLNLEDLALKSFFSTEIYDEICNIVSLKLPKVKDIDSDNNIETGEEIIKKRQICLKKAQEMKNIILSEIRKLKT
ncbi:hypothetical protein ACFL5N_00530, partial [bacterium]